MELSVSIARKAELVSQRSSLAPELCEKQVCVILTSAG